MTVIFPKWMKDTIPQIQAALWAPSRKILKDLTVR